MNKKLYVAGGYDNSVDWVLDLGFEHTKDLEKSDAIFYTGGSDISTYLYGENTGKRTFCNPERDKYEFHLFNHCADKLKIGVCRGGQLLTVANGYKLVQDSQHPHFHNISTFDNKVLYASSTHHQQFLLQPNNLMKPAEFKLIGWANKLSNNHLDGDNKDYKFGKNYQEPEIVIYNHEQFGKSIAIQMHPEFFDFDHPTVRYLQGLIKDNL